MEQLEEWAVKNFQGVGNKDVIPPDLSVPRLPFDQENQGQVVKFQPIKDKD